MGLAGTISKMSPSLGRLRILLTTVLVLLVPLFIYYTFYVANQAAYFTNRDFRLLSLISSQISTKVEGLSVVFKLAGDKYASRADDARGVEETQTYLRESGIQSSAADFRRTTPEPIKEKGHDSNVTLDVSQEDGIQWLYFHYSYESKGNRVEMQGRVDFNSLIGPQVGSGAGSLASPGDEDGFENILIAQASPEGQVIFQQDTSMLRLMSLDKLTPAEGGDGHIDFGAAGKVSSVLDVKLAGSNYKLFLHPLTLSLAQAGVPNTQSTPWIVCGLIPSAQFNREILSVSYTVLIIFSYITALAVLSWPFLKLILIGPKGRLGTADIYFLGFSMLVGLSLMTSLCLYLYSYNALEVQLDDQLKKLSATINGNFQKEVSDSLVELNTLNSERGVTEALDKLAGLDPGTNGTADESSHNRTDLLSIIGPDDSGHRYPYFDTAVWINPDGWQKFKWTVRKKATPLIDVSSRPYFRNLREGRYRYADGHEFWLEPILSKTTGRNEVELSQRVPRHPEWVSAFDTRLLSLMQPVLPAGYGYCVIDNDGRVLFHSDETHHLGENFFQECDDDHSLHAAVLDRAQAELNVHYLGRGHRLFTSPVKNFPTWTLVVFRDKQILRTTFLEMLTLSTLFFLAYSLVLLVALSVFYLVNMNPSRRRAWLWPSGALTPNYYLSVMVLLALSLVSAAFIVFMRGLWIIVPVSLVSFIGIGFFVLNLKYGRRFRDWEGLKRSRLWGRTYGLRAALRRNHFAYVLNVLFLLLLVAIIPSVGFFKVAYESEIALFIKYGQVTIANGLAERDERVYSQYASDGGEAARKFVARRLALDLDVYDNFFFDTQRGPMQTVAPSCHGGLPSAFLVFVKKFMPLYNKTSEVKQGLVARAFADKQRWWEEVESDKLILHAAARPSGPALPWYHLNTKVPGFDMPGVFWWLVPLAAFVPYFLWIQFAVRKAFLLDLHKPASHTFEELFERGAHRNLFVILDAPYTQKKRLRKDLFRLVDLRETAAEQGWAEKFDYDSLRRGGKRAVAVDHFEYKFDDPEANRQKTLFLENLLRRGYVTVVISTVGRSRYRLAQGDSGGGEESGAASSLGTADRWSGIISGFLKVYVEDGGSREVFREEVDGLARQLASHLNEGELSEREKEMNLRRFERLVETLKDECSPKAPLQQIGLAVLGQPDFATLTRDHLINRVRSQAGTYYQEVWASCSSDERLTLFHLAQDRLLSPNDPDIEPLLRRGLIVRAPDVHLMNESFRRFVTAEKGVQVLSQYEQEAKRGSLWHALKPPLLVTLISSVGFLFVTQRSLYNSSLAIMTAITTAIPAFFKLLSFLHKDPVGHTDEQSPPAKE